MRKVVLALLLQAWPLFAQQGATAELIGTVSSGGQKLPGVTVTLASEALQGARSTSTGENGGYRFPFLPPADYIVHFELQGFVRAERRVHVSLTEAVRADVDLVETPLKQEMTVTAGSRSEDASVGIDVNSSTLERFPGPRDIRAVVDLSPSANTLGIRGGVVIAGAPSWDSLYLVDGVVAGEYLSGQPHNVALEDAIQEIVVLNGAISAEYGRFTGGVVSTLTKSGGNEFKGSVRDTISNPAWTTTTPWPGQPKSASRTNDALEATLGGFIVRDRLWFFGASRNAQNTASRFTTLTNIPYPSTARDERWQTKLTNQITPRHSLIVSYANASLREQNVTDTRTGGNVLDRSALITDRSQPTRLLSATYTGVPVTNTAAELQVSQKRYALRGNGGRSTDPILGTVIAATGGNMNAPIGCGICGDDERDSKSAEAKASTYRNTRWGNLTTVIGAASFRERRTNAGTRSSSEFNIEAGAPRIVGQTAYPFFGKGTLIDWTHHFPGDVGSHLNTTSAYANSRWEIGSRTTFSLGLRYDRNYAKDALGRLISNDGAVSPRLSAIYDLRRDGRQQLLASYGRYGAKMLEGGGSNQQVGTFNQFAWKYGGLSINGLAVPNEQLLPTPIALATLFAWFNSIGGFNNRDYLQFITTLDSSVFHGALKSPSVDERSIGYSFHWPTAYVRADVIARDWHNFYAARVDRATGQQTNALGDTVDLVSIVNDNSETIRKYRAVQIEGSLRRTRLSIGGGYTWSRLWGNDDEEDGVSLTQPRNLPLKWWYPELLGYPQRRPIGYLKQDERNRARVWVTYVREPVTVSFVQRFDSGRPYSAVAIIDPTGVVPNPGYVLNQVHTGPYYFSKRGEFRTDDVSSTDVSLQYDMALSGARLFVKGDLLNAFNNAAVVAPKTAVTAARNDLAPFNPFTQTPVEGVNYDVLPNFGKPTGPESYQTPRTFQIAIGARF